MSDGNFERPSLVGSCHCGAANWTLDDVPVSATICNCSICRRYGALWAYGFFNEQVTVSGDTQVYLWGRHSIEFHFCSKCGCVVFWRAATFGADGRQWGAVNLRLAVDPTSVSAIALVHHDTVGMAGLPPDGMCVSNVWA